MSSSAGGLRFAETWGTFSARCRPKSRQRPAVLRRTNAAVRAFESGLEARDWTALHLNSLQAQLDEIRRLDPQQADAALDRLCQRMAVSIRESLGRPNLRADDVARIETRLNLLN